VGYIATSRRRHCIADESHCDSDMNSAQQLFELFHSFPAPRVLNQPCPRMVPPLLVKLGELRGLIYRSDKEQCGRPRTFIHFMETPPLLTCNPAGTQLYIVGGNYRVTPRGIEG
jgi:hypothetical protein